MSGHHRPSWIASRSAAQNASLKLPALSKAYFKAGRQILAGNSSVQTLHGFRLETKRFRYTLELFRPVYGPGIDLRLARLREIQDFMGEINDCAATQQLLGKHGKKFATFLERKIVRKRRELRSYWRRTFDAPGQERWWADYLARFAKEVSN